MKQLSAQARSAIEGARGYDDPAPADRARVYRAFRNRLAMGSAATAAGVTARSAFGGGLAFKALGGWSALEPSLWAPAARRSERR